MYADPKFTKGVLARETWAKPIETDKLFSMETYVEKTQADFQQAAHIVLDPSPKRQTTIRVEPLDVSTWNKTGEYVYAFLYDGNIIKIGGTRKSMKNRFGSYLCGHHVRERGKSGKMSVTNAHLYHTIEKTLMEGHKWEIWTWTLPCETLERNILGEVVRIAPQTYQAYETCAIRAFKKITGFNPWLSDNCDPTY